MQKLNELGSEIDRCSKCGNCLGNCPLYQEKHREALVARGKIRLISEKVEGKLAWTLRVRNIMANCLLCRTCEKNCPNGVQYGKLIQATRNEIAAAYGVGFGKKIAFHHVINNAGRLALIMKLLRIYQHSGLQSVLRKYGAIQAFSRGMGEMERLLPTIANRPLNKEVPQIIRASDEKHRIAYFYGCMTNHVYKDTGLALIKTMVANNITVIIPEQVCCGLPAWASGDEEAMREMARKNIQMFKQAGAERIIVDCGSCGSMLKEYGEILGTEEAEEFSAKVRDVTEFLLEDIDFKIGVKPVEETVTYHDPCHLKRYQGIFKEPRELLKSILGINFIEMLGADKCCGASGSYALTNYRLSMSVGGKKIEPVQKTGANILVTGCPSCRLQFETMFREKKVPIQVRHTIELIGQTY
jgi:glycolate oxidase iron-sulfur subunit